MFCPSPENVLHFHVEMAHFGGILAVKFIFYSMNKTVKNTPKSKRRRRNKVLYILRRESKGGLGILGII